MLKPMTKLSLLALSLSAGPAFAQATAATAPAAGSSDAAAAAPKVEVAKPSPDAVRSAWNFFYKGKGQGLVLVDAKLCTEIGKDGDTKSECTKEVGSEGVKANAPVHVWQAYIIPQGDSIEDITLQVKQGDTVRETKDIKVKGDSIRTRTWNQIRFPKPGAWTVVLNRGAEVLKTFNVTVTK